MEENEIDLYSFWLIIKKNRWLIIWLFVISVLAAMIISLLQPKTYRATASIFPLIETPNMGQPTTSMNAAGKNSPLPDASDFGIFIAILKSRTMLDEIIDKFNLQEIYKCKTKQDTRKLLRKKTEINVSKEWVINISVIDTNPQRAADIANSYIVALDQLILNFSITSAGQMRKFIEGRLKETREALNNAEEKLKAYQISHKILVEKEVQETARAAGELQGRLISAKVELEAKKKYTTPQNPDLIKLQNEVIELERSITSLPPLETELSRLIRELKSQETLYNLLLSQYEQAKINEARDTPIVRVLDWATVPEEKYKPSVKLNMAVAGILAIFIGIFISFLNEFLAARGSEPRQVPVHANQKGTGI